MHHFFQNLSMISQMLNRFIFLQAAENSNLSVSLPTLCPKGVLSISELCYILVYDCDFNFHVSDFENKCVLTHTHIYI